MRWRVLHYKMQRYVCDVHPQERHGRAPSDQCGPGRGDAEVDAQIAVHRSGLRQHAVFPAGDRLDRHPKVVGEVALAQAQLFAVCSNLFAGKQTKLFAERRGNLLVGAVLENHLAARLAARHAKPRDLDRVGAARRA